MKVNQPSDSGQIMPRLLLIRHAKAAAFGSAPGDHGRPLSPKGKAHAAILGEALRAAGWAPDLALVSTAQRTRDTIAAMALPDCAVRYEDALYLASPKALAEAISTCDTRAKTIALIAHNPGIAMLAHQFLEEGFDHNAKAAHALMDNFRTGWAAAFELREDGPRLVDLFDPRACGTGSANY
ncbi:MAG: histidine phosphatase [Robiginitomaculum sp.]|nr:MAG: histidine phosphatase [Robiginitomaculum sp.]